jgi:hypothetical protein
LIAGELAESVTSLKSRHRGNLISFGCGELAYELAKQGLADEIHFWINPGSEEAATGPSTAARSGSA